MFGSRVGFSRSADRMTLFPVAPNPRSWKFQMAISPEQDVRSTSCLILGWGFLGRRIEWTYYSYRLDQIQDCSWPPSWKISSGHISGTGHPIHFVFDSRVGFSRSSDRMVLFLVGPNPRSRPSTVLRYFEWPYL